MQNWDSTRELTVRPRKWPNLHKNLSAAIMMFNSLSYTDYYLLINLWYFVHKCIRKKVEGLNNLQLFHPNQEVKMSKLWAEHWGKYDNIFLKILYMYWFLLKTIHWVLLSCIYQLMLSVLHTNFDWHIC